MTEPEPAPEIADEVPWSDHVTGCDDRHGAICLRLLDPDAQGAGNEDMARETLGIDPASYRGKAPAGGWWPTTDRMENFNI